MLSENEHREVNRLIDMFIVGKDTGFVYPERGAIEATGVLPALEDWSAFGGISRNCEIVWVDREPPFALRSIEDTRIRRIVLFEASQRYPSLVSLHPVRPQDALGCTYCNGSGRVSLGIKEQTITIGGRERKVRDLEDAIRCYCGGLGWLVTGECSHGG